jgi:glycylpeptide N-tetradecanoyltransferase
LVSLSPTHTVLEKELVNVLADGPIREFVPEAIQREPYPLPNGFGFVLVDILAEKDMDELYRLLRDNYVEDYDSKFRFDYSKDFLEWYL